MHKISAVCLQYLSGVGVLTVRVFVSVQQSVFVVLLIVEFDFTYTLLKIGRFWIRNNYKCQGATCRDQ